MSDYRETDVVWQGRVDDAYSSEYRVLYSRERGYRVQERFAGDLPGESRWSAPDLIERNVWGMIVSALLRQQRGEPPPEYAERKLQRKIDED